MTILRGLQTAGLEDRAEPVNAISRGFSILGDEWSLLLLRFALSGCRRYADFAAELPISHAVLSNRLGTLVTWGLLERREYQQRPPRSEYVLTEVGYSTWPILVAIWSWERHWVSEGDYDAPSLEHTTCGREVTAVLTCEACGALTGALDVETSWGPSGGWRRSVPEATTRRRSASRGAPVEHTFRPDTMALIGNRWSTALVSAALLGVRRFSDFETVLGSPPSLLSGRLAQLCDAGILVHADEGAERGEYRLTERGLAFYPVVVGIVRWAERWFGCPEGPALQSIHLACGERFHPVLACSHCHQPITEDSLKVEL